MKIILLYFFTILSTSIVSAQINFSGFGQVTYNKLLQDNTIRSGSIFVENFSIIGTLNYNDRLKATTEIAYGERSFITSNENFDINQLNVRYEIKPWLRLKAGVLLLPIGLINEFRDPTAYAGVRRPFTEFLTLRDLGIGFTGVIDDANLKYETYLVNGFNSFTYDENDDDNTIGKGQFFIGPFPQINFGRQSVFDSNIRSVAITNKLEYYGINGLKLGSTLYYGKTNSDIHQYIDKDNKTLVNKADSTVLDITIGTLYGVYTNSGFTIRAQGTLTGYGNSNEYNAFAKNNSISEIKLDSIQNAYTIPEEDRVTISDVPELALGSYLELSYNIFHNKSSITHKLSPYARYEYINGHLKVGKETRKKTENVAHRLTLGASWQPTNSVIFKTDYTLNGWKASSDDTFNTGFDWDTTLGKHEFNMAVGINLAK